MDTTRRSCTRRTGSGSSLPASRSPNAPANLDSRLPPVTTVKRVDTSPTGHDGNEGRRPVCQQCFTDLKTEMGWTSHAS
jgi:hypothetical protein